MSRQVDLGQIVPNIQVGTTTTGSPSTPASVENAGTDLNPILNFTVPKGDVGPQGPQGIQGIQGDTGNGIASIAKTSTSGLVDTYTITFTNGQTTTFEVTNGANGDVVDVQVDGTSVVDNGVANIILADIKQELEDMYNLLPKVSGTGETITLDGTVAGKMLINLKGNTSQEGTPTPESPQDIHVVSGNNSINVCGKNLLPINSLIPTFNTTTTLIDFGKDKTFDSVTLSFIFNGSYSQVTNVAMFDLRTNDNTHNYLTPDTFGLSRDTLYTNQQLSTTKTNVTFRYLIVYFMTNNYNNFSANSTMTNIQLEKSSTATTYEAYKGASYPINLGTTELCKIGDYQDSIVKDNGKWYLNKQIGKYILKTTAGSNTWYTTGTGNKDYQLTLSGTNRIHLGASNQGLSNYFRVANSGTDIYLWPILQSGVDYIRIANATDKWASLDDFKNYITDNQVEYIYRLDTPTITEITDSTLISQLETVKRSYNGQTNISQNNTDLPFIINATALKEMA